MSDDNSTALRKAASVIQKLRRQIEHRDDARHAPIAVVGVGCRFPGGSDTPARYWRLFVEGRDGVTDVPEDRWSHESYVDPDRSAPGRTVTRRAAFVDGIHDFDAGFFGISPREARQMDPQQRVLLEVAWDAIADAGIATGSVHGTSTSVFVGCFNSDFAHEVFASTESCDTYSATGALDALLANRISYLLGAQGPSMAVDTACSSGLVAVHLAVRSLRSGESDLALAGAVSLMLTPGAFVSYSQGGMLSPDGRCFTFDHRANGYGRGEGAGIVVLKRLEDARRDGDRVLAIIRGTAINQDGRSNGLTAPSAEAQRRVIRAALADGRVEPGCVEYVETHGTGTALGDPIEVEALDTIYGRAEGRPCLLGAHKTNVGHLEAAAGIAGFIKAVLCLQHRFVPANLNFEAQNPRLTLDAGRLELALRGGPWPGQGPRFAAVSSFGVGGTNAHAVLEEAPPSEPDVHRLTPKGGQRLLVLSARSPEALRALAGRMASLLEGHDAPPWPETCAAAGRRRDHHPVRASVVADDRAAAVARLAELAQGELPTLASIGQQPVTGPPRVVFVFSGQGGQWAGMGRELYRDDETFRATLDAVDAAIVAHTGQSVRPWLLAEPPGDGHAAPEPPVDLVQPAIFAMQVALAAAVRRYGPTPGAVLGHSMGEVAAAHVAGALSLEDAALVICTRSRLAREQASGKGAMAVVALPATTLAARLPSEAPGLEVAVVNSPGSAVISGDLDAMDRFLATMEREAVWHRRIRVDYASHCHHMEPLGHALRARLARIAPVPEAVPFFSTVAARYRAGEQLGADYWVENLRRTVRFSDAVVALASETPTLFVEIGPHPVLAAAIAENIESIEADADAAPTLLRHSPARQSLLAGLGRMYTSGVELDWAALYPGHPSHVPLPTYPWQRERYEAQWSRTRPAAGPARQDSLRWVPATPERRQSSDPGAAAGAPKVDLVAELEALPEVQRRRRLEALVRASVALTMGLADGHALNPDQGFFDQGMDSIMSVELGRRLADKLDRKLPATTGFDHPTVNALTRHLYDLLFGRAGEGAPVEHTPDRGQDEGIAVIGVGIRLPGGVAGPDRFWQRLVEGWDAIGPVPPDRWSPAEQPNAPTVGGFLDDVAGFDAAFFGIAPREARWLDPQQRLALEVTWEALEHAGIPIARLDGRRVGVFLGAFQSQYLDWSGLDPSTPLDAYSMTGNMLGTAAGRLSYVLRVRGPSVAIETACSSSLVSIHLACQSLRTGESHLALAGGVNLMLSPLGVEAYVPTGALAADGRCKTFDARADGLVRGEGCGMVVLKRLADARRDGDRVLAVIRGSAVNHDGPASGLTVPSGLAQQEVVRQALDMAGVSAGQVGFVETHGTGTALGDPIEVGALSATYGAADDRSAPMMLGAVKTNVGHTEIAAGVVGFVKAVLCLQHRAVPGNLHLASPNPKLGLDRAPFVLPAALTPWPEGYARRFAAVSAFGIGGTNAHVVLEEAPPTQPGDARLEARSGAQLLTLSARSEGALRALAGRMQTLLEPDDAPGLAEACAAAARHRDHHPVRAALVAADRDAARAALGELAEGDLPAQASIGRRPTGAPPRVLFVFSGQGGAWGGMGRELHAIDPAFEAAVDRCDALFTALGVPSPRATLIDPVADPGAQSAERLQAAQFTLQVGLVESLARVGVRPDAVLGHSLGELAAAWASGALSLEDAVKVVVARSRAVHAAPEGAIVVVALDEVVTAAHIDGSGLELDIAAVNDPLSTVVVGPPDQVDVFVEAMARASVWVRRVPVSHAVHSRMIAPLEGSLREAVAGITPRGARVPFISTLTGEARAGETLGAPYWGRNLVGQVRFADAMATFAAEPGPLVVVEVGPHPLLARSVARITEGREGPITIAPTLRRGQPARRSLLEGIGRIYTAGVDPDWVAMHPGEPPHVTLPTYPWQRRRYWLDRRPGPGRGAALGAAPPIESPRLDEIVEMHGLAPDPRPQAVERRIWRAVRATLGLMPDEPLGPDVDLFDVGLDSMTSLDLVRRLSHGLGLELDSGTVLANPTPARLVASLLARLKLPEPAEGSAVSAEGSALSAEQTPPANPWCVVRRPRPNARLQLICLPYSAGGAGLFSRWPERLPDDIEVCAIRLPGRESRSAEAPIADLSTLLDVLAPAVARVIRGPYVLFGYSLGALIAHDLAHALIRRSSQPPVALVAASAADPACWPPASDDALTDDGLMDFLLAGGVVEPAVLEDSALRRAILDRMRADIALISSRGEPADVAPLPCPIHLFSGRDDHVTPLETMLPWARRTTADVALHRARGGHFFIHGDPEWLMSRLQHILASTAHPGPPTPRSSER